MTTSTAMLWRRVDVPGHDAARVTEDTAGAVIDGSAVFAEEARPCRLDYVVTCDREWRTVSARVAGWLGVVPVALEVTVADGRWTVNGEARPDLDGCLDIDLSFTPATNLIAVRRLRLAVGTKAPARAAWLRIAGTQMALEVLDQTYERLSARTYRYESAGGSFAADLQVSEAGLVTHYPGLWDAVAVG